MNFLDETDRKVLAHMIETRPRAFGSILEALAWIAAEREEAAPPGPDKERWGLAVRIATEATVAARTVGL